MKISRLTLPPRSEAFSSLADFAIEREIGCGGFSRVFAAEHLATKTKFALKRIDLSRLHESNMPNIERELEAHSKMDSPNIVRFYGWFSEGESLLFLVLELCIKGNLFQKLVACPRLPEREIRRLFKEICFAINQVHSKGYVMRDLKPENVLLSDSGAAKLCDFGWCARLNDAEFRAARAGTTAYMSPEALRGEPQDERSDIWALGIFLYELFMAKEPFAASNHRDQLRAILIGPPAFSPLRAVPPSAKRLILEALQIDPNSRPSLAAILGSQFFRENETRISTVISEPNRRAACSVDLKRNAFLSSQDFFAQLKPVEQKAADPPELKYSQGPENSDSRSSALKLPAGPQPLTSSYTDSANRFVNHRFAPVDSSSQVSRQLTPASSPVRAPTFERALLVSPCATDQKTQTISSNTMEKLPSFGSPSTSEQRTQKVFSNSGENLAVFGSPCGTNQKTQTILSNTVEKQTSFGSPSTAEQKSQKLFSSTVERQMVFGSPSISEQKMQKLFSNALEKQVVFGCPSFTDTNIQKITSNKFEEGLNLGSPSTATQKSSKIFLGANGDGTPGSKNLREFKENVEPVSYERHVPSPMINSSGPRGSTEYSIETEKATNNRNFPREILTNLRIDPVREQQRVVKDKGFDEFMRRGRPRLEVPTLTQCSSIASFKTSQDSLVSSLRSLPAEAAPPFFFGQSSRPPSGLLPHPQEFPLTSNQNHLPPFMAQTTPKNQSTYQPLPTYLGRTGPSQPPESLIFRTSSPPPQPQPQPQPQPMFHPPLSPQHMPQNFAFLQGRLSPQACPSPTWNPTSSFQNSPPLTSFYKGNVTLNGNVSHPIEQNFAPSSIKRIPFVPDVRCRPRTSDNVPGYPFSPSSSPPESPQIIKDNQRFQSPQSQIHYPPCYSPTQKLSSPSPYQTSYQSPNLKTIRFTQIPPTNENSDLRNLAPEQRTLRSFELFGDEYARRRESLAANAISPPRVGFCPMQYRPNPEFF